MKRVLFSVLTVLAAASCRAAMADIVINEVCYKNRSTEDATGSFLSDWVELYNRGKSAIDIKGYSIGLKKDYATSRQKGKLFTFDVSYQMDPGEFLVVFFNKDLDAITVWMGNGAGKRVPWMRTNAFSLGTSLDGASDAYPGVTVQDDVRLFGNDSAHTRISNFKGDDLAAQLEEKLDDEGVRVRVLDRDATYGYLVDGDVRTAPMVLGRGTPWRSNLEGLVVQPPVLSGTPPGYSKGTARGSLRALNRLYTVYYTLDGSDPATSPTAVKGTSFSIAASPDATVDSGEGRTNAWIRTSPVELAGREPAAAWSPPIGPVPRATTLRAVCRYGEQVSAETRATWFVGPAFENRALPIVSVSAPPERLFGPNGIYVPGVLYETYGYGSNKWGKPYANYFMDPVGGDEVPAHFELLEPGDAASALSFDMGLTMHGGGTRALPQKTLYCVLRKEFDPDVKSVTYPLIPELGERTFKRFLLRADGNDWYGPSEEGVSTMMKDAVFHRIVAGLDMGTMAYRPAVVYLNGDYWGVHNIREAVDKQYFATRFGLDADNIDLLTHEDDGDKVHIERIEGDSEADEDYEALLRALAVVNPAAAEGYRAFANAIDVDNYTDYIIAETFFANTDWPINNCDFWRAHTNESANAYGDGRWRWILYDLDLAGLKVDGEGGAQRNMFKYLSGSGMAAVDEPAFLINRLWQNAAYCDRFVARYTNLLATVLHPASTSRVIRDAAAEIVDEIERHYRRWGRPFTAEDWAGAVEGALVDFTAERWRNSYKHLNAKFDLGGVSFVSVATNGASAGGSVLVAGKPIGGDGFIACYLSNVSLALEAKPAPCHRFVRWSDGSPDAVRVLSVRQGRDVDVYPIFEFDAAGAAAPWPDEDDGAYDPSAAHVYNGYVADADGAVAATVVLKAAKGVAGAGGATVKATATVTDASGRRWSYSKGAGECVAGGRLAITGLVCTARGAVVPEFSASLGANGMRGEFGGLEIVGSRDGMAVRGDEMAAAAERDFKGSWSFAFEDGTRLQVAVDAKGVAKVVGATADGFKIALSAQALMGTDCASMLVPVAATLKQGRETKEVDFLLCLMAPDDSGDRAARAIASSFGPSAAGGATEPPAIREREARRTLQEGVAHREEFTVQDLAYPVKFSASRLPAGLKLSADGVLAGAPTKAGAYASEVKATSAVNAKWTDAVAIAFEVAPMPEWLYGTYAGATDLGLVQLTVAKGTGKISGKVSENGTNWTCTAASFSSATATDGTGDYFADVVLKSGKTVCTNLWRFVRREAADDFGWQGTFAAATAPEGVSSAPTGEQVRWKVEPWKGAMKRFAAAWPKGVVVLLDESGAEIARGGADGKAPAVAVEPWAAVTFKFSAGGDATAACKFTTGVDARGRAVVYSASCKSTLSLSDGGATLVAPVRIPAKAGRFAGFSGDFEFEVDADGR